MTKEPSRKSRFWRRFRVIFRRFRIAVLIVILLLLCCLIYLNQVGLPGFVKRPLLERLEEAGVDLEFTRLRWRWYRGIVAENVRFGRADEPFSPRMTLREAQVRINHRALLGLKLQVEGLVLRDGELAIPVADTNNLSRELLIGNVRAELRFLPDDQWQLDEFQARFAGADFRVTGILTNASAVREWEWFRPSAPVPPDVIQNRLRVVADTLREIHFAAPPGLRMDLRGDARDLQSFSIRLRVDAPDAETPWGSFQEGYLAILLHPARSNVFSSAEVRLNARSAQTRWAATTNLVLELQLSSSDPRATNMDVTLRTTAEQVESPWGRGADMRFDARWVQNRTHPIPVSGTGELSVRDAHAGIGQAAHAEFTCVMTRPEQEIEGDPGWGWWTNLAPHRLQWQARLTGLNSTNVTADELVCAGDWNAPHLSITNLSGELYEGRLAGRADLNVATRELTFGGTCDFNGHRVSRLLTPGGRRWLEQFAWDRPPLVEARGSLTLPAWTNQHPDWRGEVRPTLQLDGRFQIAAGAFRGIPFTSARSRFTYTNLFWQLPDLMVVRPEGSAEIVHYSSDATRNFYFKVRSSIDPAAVRPLLEPGQQRAFELMQFTEPPRVNAEVWGRWEARERIAVKAQVAVTNFSFRGESADRLEASLQYSNRILHVTEPRVYRGTGQLAAAAVRVDFNADKVYVTNGFSTMEPMPVARAIGRVVTRAIQPYTFGQAPTVHVNGIIPTRDERDADLHFTVEGGPLTWWKFRSRHVSGKVDWVGERVSLRGVQAEFYDGVAVGEAEFDFSPPRGADFRLDMIATDADISALMRDLSARTNRVEGLLTARATITHAHTEDWRSVNGRGRAHLRDGMIWEFPIFGIFSPVLDALVPGLGNSRARQASATFGITNGVLTSNDLEIHTSGARLHYSGSVTFEGDLDARVEAELLRDTWVVGRVLSLALWPISKVFEYRISGTLHQPRMEPVYFVPKIMRLPVDILREMRERPASSEPSPAREPASP